MEDAYYILDSSRIRQAITKCGYASVSQFATRLGLHRNTVIGYLSGQSCLPRALEKILSALDLKASEVIIQKQTAKQIAGLKIEKLLSSLISLEPHCAFFLFGSRARGKAKDYSDYDVGLYKKEELPFKAYSKLLSLVDEWNQNNFSEVQLVNFCNADKEFLENTIDDMHFLGGDFSEWVNIFRKAERKIFE